MKILVLGVTGMLGSAVFKTLSEHHDVYGTARVSASKSFFHNTLQQKMIVGLVVLDQDALVNLLGDLKQGKCMKPPVMARHTGRVEISNVHLCNHVI